jgi:hypothetical protein
MRTIVAHKQDLRSSSMVSASLVKKENRTAGSQTSLEVGDKGKTGESR